MFRHGMIAISLILSSSLAVMNPGYADGSASLDVKSAILNLKNGNLSLPISIKSPLFTIGEINAGNTLPVNIEGDISSGRPIEVSYSPISIDEHVSLDVKLHVQWSPGESVIRKWTDYRITGGTSDVVKEIVLDDIDTVVCGLKFIQNEPILAFPQSYPVFTEGFFAGIEFPMASTKIDGSRFVLAHQPGIRMKPGVWYTSRKAVYGTSPKGSEWARFRAYIESYRPEPRGTFVIYDNWLSTANTYTEQEMLDLMHLLDDKLYKQNGVSIDAFRLVCTWSNPQSIWEVDKKRFPDGLSNFRKAVEDMGGHMGLWISPASCYPFAQDGEWAGKNGYETFTEGTGPNIFYHTCIAGRKFQTRFKDNLVDMVKTYDIRHIQFDGYRFECPESGHGHEPGALSAEAVASGMIDVFQSLRKVNPRIYLHGAYGGNPSPWWLFYINTFLVYYGDDAPYGRVPAPSYRESYISGRDQANLQAAYHCPSPISAHDVYGLYDHAPYPFVNDAVMAIMRGHLTNSIIVNPKFKNDRDWVKIAEVTKWSRKNLPILKHTLPILPASWQGGKCPMLTPAVPMPREPYGYAHCDGRKGLVAIRNPWITTATYSLKLDESINLSKDASGLSAVSIYPETRTYAKNIGYGDTIQVPLAPYELVVLSLSPKQKTKDVPDAGESLRKRIEFKISRSDIQRVKFEGSSEKMGSDWMSRVGDTSSALKISLGSVVDIEAPQAELLVLLEDMDLEDPIYSIKINGTEAPVTYSDSESAFAATGGPRPERWIFLHAPLAKGQNMVSLDLMTRNATSKVSVWVLASKPGSEKQSDYPNALPQPEIINLDSVNLIPAIDAGDASLREINMQRPVEKIDGIYVDALDKSAFTKGSSDFTKNANFTDGPMLVYGRRYLRGLCTHAPSKIGISLDGKYKRFQSWVGVDQGMPSYDRSSVIFQIFIDGEKRWESSPITRYDPPAFADVDLTGAKSIELVAVDALNKDPVYHANWSNWGEAKLLR